MSDDAADDLSDVGVGDSREKYVRVVTAADKEIDHEDVFLRHTETEFLLSPDVNFPRSETTRYRKADVDRVEITQHHTNCFITTAAAGEGRTLDSLRGFRDEVLAPSRVGRPLLAVYDAASPPIAATLARHPDAGPTRLVRRLTEYCGTLARRRRHAASDGGRAVRSVALVCLYVLGVCLAAVAHCWLLGRERLGGADGDLN